MLICESCGEINRPGAIYCRRCGGRLINPELMKKEEQKRLKATKSKLNKQYHSQKSILKIIIVLSVFVFFMYLIIQPVKTPHKLTITQRYTDKFETKLLRLKESYNNKTKYRIAVTEDELNSYLKTNFPTDDTKSLEVFLDDGMLIFLKNKIYNKEIALKIYSGLQIENNQYKIDILQVRLGKLPIPSFVVEFIINKFFLQRFAKDLQTPPFITNFEFTENLMFIQYNHDKKNRSSGKNLVPESADELLVKANTLYKNKEFKRALTTYKKIIKSYPKDQRIPEIKKWCEKINTQLLR